MAKAKPKRERRTITLARPKTELAQVADPYGDSRPVEVNRIIDPLLNLARHGHITQSQFKAGDDYRNSVETLEAGPGGSMDFNRAKGTYGRAPIAPPITFLEAAEAVREAKQKLWPRHHAIVHRVCVLGRTFEAVSQELTALDLGHKYVRRDIATIFSESLDMLAEMWEPRWKAREARIRAVIHDKPRVTDAVTVEAQPAAAHATRDKVYWSDMEKRR